MARIRLYFIILFFLFFTGCAKFDFDSLIKKFGRKNEIEYFPNGCPKHSISYFNSKFDGEMLRWNKNCILISRANYENGKLHGLWESFYDDGTIMHSINYFYGQKNGFERWYYPSGKLKTQTMYKFNRKESEIMSWDESGKIIN